MPLYRIPLYTVIPLGHANLIRSLPSCRRKLLEGGKIDQCFFPYAPGYHFWDSGMPVSRVNVFFLRADVRFWRPPSWAVLRHGSGSWRHESGPFHPLFLFLTLMFLFLTLQGIISGISRQSPHSPNVFYLGLVFFLAART